MNRRRERVASKKSGRVAEVLVNAQRCTEPPRNATEGSAKHTGCQLDSAGDIVRLEKTDLLSKQVVAARRSARSVVREPLGACTLLCPAAELFR